MSDTMSVARYSSEAMFVCLMLKVPVNSYGHARRLPPFYGMSSKYWGCHGTNLCFKYNNPSKQVRLMSNELHHEKTGFLPLRKQRRGSADQLCSNCTADQRLCFRYTDSTISLLLKSEISSF